eukprot:191781_1
MPTATNMKLDDIKIELDVLYEWYLKNDNKNKNTKKNKRSRNKIAFVEDIYNVLYCPFMDLKTSGHTTNMLKKLEVTQWWKPFLMLFKHKNTVYIPIIFVKKIPTTWRTQNQWREVENILDLIAEPTKIIKIRLNNNNFNKIVNDGNISQIQKYQQQNFPIGNQIDGIELEPNDMKIFDSNIFTKENMEEKKVDKVQKTMA